MSASADRRQRAEAKPATARDKAYAFLVDGMVSGRFEAGDFLEEERISLAAGVSRTPVREAFARLQSERFIELVPRRGARVRGVTAEEMLELYETRRLIEGFAATKVCLAGAGAPRAMVDLAAEMRALGARDLRAHVELDRAYHRALMEACGNAVLVEVCDGLRARQQQVAYAAVRADPSRLGVIVDEHDRMVAALDAGDCEEVVTVLNQHLQPIAQVLATLR